MWVLTLEVFGERQVVGFDTLAEAIAAGKNNPRAVEIRQVQP